VTAGVRRSRGARPRPTIAERLFSPDGRFAAAAVAVALAFLLGGGARDDITSLILLRPLAIGLVALALYRPGPRWRANAGPPLWLLGALLAWAVIQLIPLPHGIWSALPGRSMVAANDAAVGLGEIARAITLSPTKTLNTVYALAVPLAVMLTVANLDGQRADRLRWVIYAALALSVLAAAAQMLGPPGGPFYFYRITNYNNPVGLFSNRNHLAIFFASAVPLLAHAALAGSSARSRRPVAVAAGAASVLALALFVLLTGSRSGALLFGGALAASATLWLIIRFDRAASWKKNLALPLAGAAAVVAAIAAAVISSSRSTTVDRFFEESMGEDLRVQVLPQLWEMLHAYFPVGAGFGAFEYAYTIFEPRSILRTTYLNHAHNDLLEFLIEGGAVAGLLLLAFAIWFARAGWCAARAVAASRRDPSARHEPAFLWLAIAVLLAGSVGDYPLRTPALMAYAALLCALLHRQTAAGQRA